VPLWHAKSCRYAGEDEFVNDKEAFDIRQGNNRSIVVDKISNEKVLDGFLIFDISKQIDTLL